MFGEIKVTEAKALPYERIKDALGLVSGQILAHRSCPRDLTLYKPALAASASSTVS